MTNSRPFNYIHGIGPKTMWLESDRVDECLEECKSNGISHLGISPFFGYSRQDLEPLKGHSFIKGLHIDAESIDIAAITSFSELEYLLVDECTQELDLTKFPNLSHFRGAWTKKLRITEECSSLKRMYLRHLGRKGSSLESLPPLPNLRHLELVQSPIKGLDGVGQFSGLLTLELSHCTKLVSLKALQELKSVPIHTLSINVCRKIRDHALCASLSSLETLHLNDCGTILDLKFVDELSKLRVFNFVDSALENGDLSPLFRLEFSGFFNKRGFSHTVDEVKAIQAENRGVGAAKKLRPKQ